MLQTVFCDDNPEELTHMARLMDRYRTERGFDCEYQTFSGGVELMAQLGRGKRFDIYCLDINMPGLSGIDVAKEIRSLDKTALILFFTSSPDFALESYTVKADNYILKPVTWEKFCSAFDDLQEQMDREGQEEALIVQGTGGIQRILVANLVYVEVLGRSVMYHLRSGKVVECAQAFGAVCETLLPYGCFVKPHRSYLVNMQYVEQISGSQILLRTHAAVPIAQGRIREVKQQYLAYQAARE